MSPQETTSRSTPRRRPLVRYLAIGLILMVSPIFVLAATVAATGTVTVKVAEKSADGVDLYLPLPAIAFDAALFAAPLFLPEDALADARKELAPYREALQALGRELAGLPSGVLVEVESDGDHVEVRKTWRSFEIRVDADDADVFVSVPARFASRLLTLI